MQKAERKRRAAERKRKAKLAKKAKRLAANNNSHGNDRSTELTAGAREEAPVTTMQEQPASDGIDVDSTSAGKMPADNADRMSTSQDAVQRAHSKMHLAEAEVIEAGTAEMLGDDEAIAMLTRAARSLDDVIQYVESVLKRLPAQQVAEAMAIKDEPRRPGEKSRNGANPAVQLINIRLRAKSLMLRVMRILKPDLAKQLQKA